jgi:16S rRNA processing protein RimM
LSGHPAGHSSSNQEQHWVWLARIRRTQGRKGEVFAEILTDFPEKFEVRRKLWLVTEPSEASGSTPEPRIVQLVHHWLHKGGIVLHFAGIDSITAAEGLMGLGVAIPREQRAVLAEDEAYISDLIGCTLVDSGGSDGTVVGEIEDVDTSAGPTPLLVVRGAGKDRHSAEILIPFAKAYLRRLDVEHKRVEMDLPEGLVDLN